MGARQLLEEKLHWVMEVIAQTAGVWEALTAPVQVQDIVLMGYKREKPPEAPKTWHIMRLENCLELSFCLSAHCRKTRNTHGKENLCMKYYDGRRT